MVLVAAIAGGVLLDTAGLLQSQAEATGEESTQQVSDRLQVFSSVAIIGGGDFDGNIIVREYDSAVSTNDGRVMLEEQLLPHNEDEIDGNVITEDGRNIVAVGGNVVTEDGEDVVRESDGRSVILNEDNRAVIEEESGIETDVFRDPEFQGGTVRTSDETHQHKRNVATASGIDVTNSSTASVIGFDAISSLEITVGTGPGSGPIDLNDTTIQYLGPDRATTLVSNETDDATAPTFEVETVLGDDDSTVLVENSDRSKIVIDLTDPDNDLEPLAAGDEVDLTIVTGSGSTTTVRLAVPSTLAGDSVVRL